MNCEGCKEHGENRFTFESAMAMAERTIKRLWVVVILLIVLFVGTNLAWIIYENSFQDISIQQEAEADDGSVAFNSNGGKVTYYGGESEFLSAIEGKDVRSTFLIMDELMDTMQVLQPRIYDSVMRKINSI